jgi:hypothetical protein
MCGFTPVDCVPKGNLPRAGKLNREIEQFQSALRRASKTRAVFKPGFLP